MECNLSVNKGFFIGQPSTNDSEVYGMADTTSGYIVGELQSKDFLNAEWVFTPTADNYYTASYQSRQVGIALDENTNAVRLSTNTSRDMFTTNFYPCEFKFLVVNNIASFDTNNVIVRFRAPLAIRQPDELVPRFSEGTNTLFELLLGGQIITHEEINYLATILLKNTEIDPIDLPASIFTASWAVGNVLNGSPYLYNMTCAPNTTATEALQAQSNQSTWQWVTLIVFTIFVIITMGLLFYTINRSRPVSETVNVSARLYELSKK